MAFLDMQELVYKEVLTGETTGLTLTGETYGGLRGYEYGEHRAIEQEGLIKINHHIWQG